MRKGLKLREYKNLIFAVCLLSSEMACNFFITAHTKTLKRGGGISRTTKKEK